MGLMNRFEQQVISLQLPLLGPMEPQANPQRALYPLQHQVSGDHTMETRVHRFQIQATTLQLEEADSVEEEVKILLPVLLRDLLEVGR